MISGTKGLFLMLAGVALFIVLVGVLTKTSQGEKTALSKFFPNSKDITIGNTKITVAVADSEATRAKGLGDVDRLAENQGMLFVFASKNTTPSFWMKGMKIPLDFIWIKDDKVSEINANIAPPQAGTPDNQLQIITPKSPIDYVVEVNAGFSEKNNIKVGDIVDLDNTL